MIKLLFEGSEEGKFDTLTYYNNTNEQFYYKYCYFACTVQYM